MDSLNLSPEMLQKRYHESWDRYLTLIGGSLYAGMYPSKFALDKARNEIFNLREIAQEMGVSVRRPESRHVTLRKYFKDSSQEEATNG